MRYVKSLLLASVLVVTPLATAKADVNVVASIKPIHSLVAAVMEGVGKPGLIVEGASSPHNYALKPSQAKMLESANVVFWVGDKLETFLKKPLVTIAANAKSVELIEAHGLIKRGFREGGAFDGHDHEEEAGHDKEAGHDDDDHKKKAEAGHDDHDDHGHKKKAEAGHEAHEDHADHGSFDPHIWLDPVNAKALVHAIEEALGAADPTNAAKYEANATAVMGKLDALIVDVVAELKPVQNKHFIVFHDAYQYFEKRFDITASGSLTVSPEVLPGGKRIAEIQKKLQKLDAACVFAEPQFEPKLVATVIEGTKAKSGVIDPLGTGIDKGPNHYFELIRAMAASLKGCLS